MGGHGREWLLEARSSLLEGRLQLMTRGFTRNRGAENVYAPERAGRSNGLAMEADFLLSSGTALHLEGSMESGSGWRRSHLAAAVELFLLRAQQ